MNDLSGAEEADGIADFRILYQAENVVIGGAGFLFCRQVLCQIGDGIPFGLEFAGVERNAASRLRPEGQGVINIVFVKPRGFDFLRSQILGQLVDNGTDHFHMSQLFRTNVGQQCLAFFIGHGVSLRKIAHGSG